MEFRAAYGFDEALSFTFYDALGRIVLEIAPQKFLFREMHLDLSKLGRGVYFMKVNDANAVKIIRL